MFTSFKSLLDPGKIQIRHLIRRDLGDVLDIDHLCFQSDCWSESDFIARLAARNTIGLVALDRGNDEYIKGFCLYELFKRKLDIIRIAVDPVLQGKGYGFTLIDKLKSKLSWDRRNKLVTRSPLDPKLCSWWKRQQFSGQWDKSEDQIKFIYHLPMEGK